MHEDTIQRHRASSGRRVAERSLRLQDPEPGPAGLSEKPVLVNSRNCKPGRPLKVGVQLSIRMGRAQDPILRVQALSKRSISRAESRRLYEDLTPKEPKINAAIRMETSRPRGLGRLTKKARRNLNRLRRL